MPRRSKLNVLAEAEGRSVRDILTEYYRKYGKQKIVAEQLGIAQSTLSQHIARLGGHEHTIIVFDEREKTS